MSRQHLSEVNAAAFADERLKIQIEDAFVFLGDKANRHRFDLIIADRPDPVGPAEVLFGDTFYQRVREALAPGGFAVFQNGVPFFQPEELTDTLKQMQRTFRYCGVYLAVVPSYIGGFMALTWVVERRDPRRPGEVGGLETAFAAARLQHRLLHARRPPRGVRAAGVDRAAGEGLIFSLHRVGTRTRGAELRNRSMDLAAGSRSGPACTT